MSMGTMSDGAKRIGYLKEKVEELEADLSRAQRELDDTQDAMDAERMAAEKAEEELQSILESGVACPRCNHLVSDKDAIYQFRQRLITCGWCAYALTENEVLVIDDPSVSRHIGAHG